VIIKPNIAILYFSRSERVEASNKNWGKLTNRFQKNQLAKILSNRTKKILKSLPLPVFHFDESRQIGDTFGDRLANAYQSLFDQGFQGVISVGNDCVELHKVDWTTVIGDLQEGYSSIGPDYRNGCYLIGCTKDQFDRNIFAKLSWQTEALIDELKNVFNEALLLPQLADLNERSDLKYLLKLKCQNIKILMLLISIFNNTIADKITSHFKVIVQLGLPSQRALRAPPSFGLAL